MYETIAHTVAEPFTTWETWYGMFFYAAWRQELAPIIKSNLRSIGEQTPWMRTETNAEKEDA